MSKSLTLSYAGHNDTSKSIENKKALLSKSQKRAPGRPRKVTPTKDGSAESNEREHFTSTDKGTVDDNQTPNRAHQETSGTKRRTLLGEDDKRATGGEDESEPKRPCPRLTPPNTSSSRFDIRPHDERSDAKRLLETAEMVTCDNLGCTGSHSPSQCPLPIMCRGCHSKDHTLSNCLHVCKRCGQTGHTTRYHDDVVPIAGEPQVRGPLARQNSEWQADTSKFVLQKLDRDHADDTQGQRTELAPPIPHDPQVATFWLRQQRIEEEARENMMQLAEIEFRIEENEMKKAHLADEWKSYDIFNGKRQDSAHKREQLNKQLEELNCQRLEDERQYEIQLLAMNERQERELTEFRQRQKRSPELAPP
ncbi:MAG: hypothetical protein Q9209_001916 [Squamulea sp. 1 TL-2023]